MHGWYGTSDNGYRLQQTLQALIAVETSNKTDVVTVQAQADSTPTCRWVLRDKQTGIRSNRQHGNSLKGNLIPANYEIAQSFCQNDHAITAAESKGCQPVLESPHECAVGL